MNEWKRQASKRIRAAIRESHRHQNIALLVHGRDDDLCWKPVLDAIEQAARDASCEEQGSAAELRRLKDFLGQSLPLDWEMQRLNRLVA